MPLPRFYGCILRRAVDTLSWHPASQWSSLTREQKGELSKKQVSKLMKSIIHAPIYAEHPNGEQEEVKVGEVVNSYLNDDDAWYIVYEINDSDEAGRQALRLVRQGALSGLSLSHDTEQLKVKEVSIVREGFRVQTGTEGELKITEYEDDVTKMASNEQEYKEENTDSAMTTLPGQPVSMSASMNAAASSSSVGSGALPVSHAPAGAGGQQPPQQQQQQQQQQQTAVKTEPGTAIDGTIESVKRTIFGSNAGMEDKKVALTAFTEQQSTINSQRGMIGEQKKKMDELKAQLEQIKRQSSRQRVLYDHLVQNIAGQLGEKLEGVDPTSGEKEGADQDYVNQSIPKLLAASYRLHNVLKRAGVAAPDEYAQPGMRAQPQQQQQYADPSLDATFQLFQEAMSGNVGFGNYGSGVPRVINASMKRQRAHEEPQQQQQQQQPGAGGWYDRVDGLLPGTRAILQATNQASGFGDSVRKQDLFSSNVANKSFIADEATSVPFQSSNRSGFE